MDVDILVRDPSGAASWRTVRPIGLGGDADGRRVEVAGDGDRSAVEAIDLLAIEAWRLPAGDLPAPDVAAITPGLYVHAKGHAYEVLHLARHSETEEALVVYRALYGDFGVWVRPAAMFAEQVTVDGRTIPRFTRVA
ncbi:DUF1653 domain-containing protein [Agromyces sp. LHK192]|uniref:DUF1653 domain-containing protein n=1 Tax=Agromyces sp. LHK192 TaxID=2498704 RepID=UPI000FD74EA8|nr:DUF1653 domain-containing protein [Agromyces sp. LHK192]